MEEEKRLQVGSLVNSKSGRDEGRIYMVYNLVDAHYVELVDGNYRKIVNPKLKKVKHLKFYNITLEKIKTKLENNKKVFDSEVYSAIKKAFE